MCPDSVTSTTLPGPRRDSRKSTSVACAPVVHWNANRDAGSRATIGQRSSPSWPFHSDARCWLRATSRQRITSSRSSIVEPRVNQPSQPAAVVSVSNTRSAGAAT